MVLSEFILALRNRGVAVSESKIRWAIRAGKLPTPRMNAAHQFDYSEGDLQRAIEHFSHHAVGMEAAPCS